MIRKATIMLIVLTSPDRYIVRDTPCSLDLELAAVGRLQTARRRAAMLRVTHTRWASRTWASAAKDACVATLVQQRATDACSWQSSRVVAFSAALPDACALDHCRCTTCTSNSTVARRSDSTASEAEPGRPVLSSAPRSTSSPRCRSPCTQSPAGRSRSGVTVAAATPLPPTSAGCCD